MIVYVSVRDNVHFDPEVEVYTDKEKAVEETIHWMENICGREFQKSSENFTLLYIFDNMGEAKAYVKACEVDEVPAMQFQQAEDPFAFEGNE